MKKLKWVLTVLGKLILGSGVIMVLGVLLALVIGLLTYANQHSPNVIDTLAHWLSHPVIWVVIIGATRVAAIGVFIYCTYQFGEGAWNVLKHIPLIWRASAPEEKLDEIYHRPKCEKTGTVLGSNEWCSEPECDCKTCTDATLKATDWAQNFGKRHDGVEQQKDT